MIIKKFKNEFLIIFISIATGILVLNLVRNFSNKIQKQISNNVIRFHILSNSDTEVDQNLKLKVRDEVLKNFENQLMDFQNIKESRNFISQNLNTIENMAKKVIHDNGYSYDVNAKLTKSIFPTRYYNNFSLPSGEYEALTLEIGDAKGKNWWCVMFPPLCFVDVTTKVNVKQDSILLKNETQQDSILLKNKTQQDSILLKNETQQDSILLKNKTQQDSILLKNKTQQDSILLKNKTQQDSILLKNKTQQDSILLKNEMQQDSILFKNKIDKDTKDFDENSSGLVKVNFVNNKDNMDSNNIEKQQSSKTLKLSQKSKEILKQNLDKDSYNIVTNEENSSQIKVKFKIVELWQNLKIGNFGTKK